MSQNPEVAQPEETQSKEALPEEVLPEEALPEEVQPDPVEKCIQDTQALRDAQKAFVDDQIKKTMRFEDSEDARAHHEFITREANYYLTIEFYERMRKTDKSDREAERLYAAMCKAYDVYHKSHEVAIQYCDEEMRKAGSYTSWLAPLD